MCPPSEQHELEVEDHTLPEIKASSERKVRIVSDVLAVEGKKAVIEGKAEVERAELVLGMDDEGEEEGKGEEERKELVLRVEDDEEEVGKAWGLETFERKTMIYHSVLVLIGAASLAIILFSEEASM